MASRLFHTVVGVGIALATATTTMACSAPAHEDISSDESALTQPAASSSGSSGSKAADCPDQGPDWDSFCDATWPTTKGGVLPLPVCIDKNNECTGEPHDCALPSDTTPGACKSWPEETFLSVCVDKKWQCKPGRIAANDCQCWEWNGGSTCTPATPPDPAK